MEKQFRVENKTTNKEHILNTEEKETFFKYQDELDYEVSELYEIESQETWKEALIVGVTGFVMVIVLTKIVLQWLN